MTRTTEEEREYNKLKKDGRIKDEFRQRQMLNMAETMKVGPYMQEHYVELKMLDADFAKHVTEKFGFNVSTGNVVGLRKSLGIESTHFRVRREQAAAKEERKLQREANLRERQYVGSRPAQAQVPAIPQDLNANSNSAELLAAVQQLYSDWKIFEDRAHEKAASTTHQIDRMTNEVTAAMRTAETARRDAALAREKYAELERKYVALQETVKNELEKIQGRLRLLTTSAGSILTANHPNGHAASAKHG